MAITLRGASTTVNSAGSASLVMTKPAGVVAGDIILIWCVSGFAAITFSDAADSMTAVTAASGSSMSHQLLWKTATGSEGSTLTVTASVSHINGAIIAAYGGASGFDPAAAAGGAGLSASPAAPSITPVNAGDTLIWFGAESMLSATAVPALAVPGGYTAQVTQANSGPGSGTQKVSVIYGDIGGAASGATGTVTGTSTPAEVAWGALLVSLQPASGGSPNAGLSAAAGVPGTPAASLSMPMTIQGA